MLPVMTTISVRRALLVTSCAVLLTAAACGSDDEPDAQADATGSSMTSPSEPMASSPEVPESSDAPNTSDAPKTSDAPMTSEPRMTSKPPMTSEPEAEVPETLAFQATTLDGEDFDAASLAGEPALFWFWAPWCPVCQGQAPQVNEFADQVTVVGVAGLDDSESAMQDFVSRTETDGFTQLSDSAGEVWKRFGIAEQSTFVLLDDTGKVVVDGSTSTDDVQSAIEGLDG